LIDEVRKIEHISEYPNIFRESIYILDYFRFISSNIFISLQNKNKGSRFFFLELINQTGVTEDAQTKTVWKEKKNKKKISNETFK